MSVLRSILFFVLAGLLEIGGGYLMWLWLREKWAWWMCVLRTKLNIDFAPT